MSEITRCVHCNAVRRDGKPLRLSDAARTMLRLAARDKRGEVQWNGYANLEVLVTQGLIDRLDGMTEAERHEADLEVNRLAKKARVALSDRLSVFDEAKRHELLRAANKSLYDALQIEHRKTAVWYRITDAGRKAVS